jgi:glutamate synthase (NADPH/NADH) small chain
MNTEVLDEVKYLGQQFHFRLLLNHPVETEEQFKHLEGAYDAIFLGVGLGETTILDLEGEQLTGCYGAIGFIERVKLDPLNAYPGDRVVIIGGGNTAMDAASESARLGVKEVTLAYRRSPVEMSAYDFEYELARSSGVRSLFHVSPVRILGTERVQGIELARMEPVHGRPRPVTGTEFVIPCDAVIKATGQTKLHGLLQKITGVDHDDIGRIRITETGQTTNPKYFAGGDAVNGGAEVVNAAAEGKKAARGIHAWLEGEG